MKSSSYAFITVTTELFVGSVGSSFQTTSRSSRYTLAHLQKQRPNWNRQLAHQTYWPFITAWCFSRGHAPFPLPSTNHSVIDFFSEFSKLLKRFGTNTGALWKLKFIYIQMLLCIRMWCSALCWHAFHIRVQ